MTDAASSLTSSQLNITPTCPHPLTRAPRLALTSSTRPGTDPGARIHLPSAALQGAVVALIYRDTQSLALSDAQRLTHLPATELVTLSWFQNTDIGLIRCSEPQFKGAHTWQAFDASCVVGGSQQSPQVSWARSLGRGGTLCFTPDIAQHLLGLDLLAVQDRFVAAHEVLDPEWWPLLDALQSSADDRAALAELEKYLAPRWRQLQGRGDTEYPGLLQIGRHWVQRLAWQAREWSRSRSPRQVERRIKAMSGRSLRQWQSIVKTEGVFQAARGRHESGQDINWADIAHDEGFADQAHLIRETKRITGFTPGEFAQRFIEDESFWMHRLWV